MIRHILRLLILTSLLLCLCACAGNLPPAADTPAPQIWTPDEEDVSDTDGTCRVEIPAGTQTADLSALGGTSASGGLHVTAPGTLKTLILPSGTVSAAVEPDAASAEKPFSLDLLDASAAEGLTQLVLYGEVKAARIPDSLHTLVFYGGDLSAFADCPSLTELSVLHPTDLSPLRDDSPPGVLALFRSPDDEKWDLSPLVRKPLTILRLMAGISSEEAAALAGASVVSLQVSDSSVDDLSFLSSMPDTKFLLLGVSSDQPPEILADPAGPYGADLLPLLNTSIPLDQLLDFAARGTVYAFTEINR